MTLAVEERPPEQLEPFVANVGARRRRRLRRAKQLRLARWGWILREWVRDADTIGEERFTVEQREARE